MIEEIKSELDVTKKSHSNLNIDQTKTLEQAKKDTKQMQSLEIKGLKEVIDEENDK